MGQKIAVAIIHGIGGTEPDFADGLMKDLRRQFTAEGADAPMGSSVMGTRLRVHCRSRFMVDRMLR